ncbi:MAG TPA: regulatory signaling modulator protein AmpE [Verrucomicrobiae bacterium]|nr:regulatory signaling modulator protein AmpE [Verrucomicrobiae bacterium]
MTFIGVLLALLAERILGHLPKVGEPMLLQQLVVSVQRYVPLGAYWRSTLAPVFLLMLGTALVAVFDWWIVHPLPNLAFGTVVLFLCLGPRHLAADIQQLIEVHASNDAGAERTLTLALLRGPGRHATRRTLFGALFIQSHERVFGVLLWFFAAGPAGAAFYRLASRMPRFLHETQPDTAAEEAAVALHAAAAWVPARLTAALYGLAGSLDQALARWQLLRNEALASWRERVWAVLAEVSAASLSSEEGEAGPVLPATLEACLKEVLAMQQRALLILLAAFGLFSLGGWTS